MGIGEGGLNTDLSTPCDNTIVLTRNSVYEIDDEHKRMRRRFGMNEPTDSMKDVDSDGWRSFEERYPMYVGGPLVVRWYGWKGMQSSSIERIVTPGDR